jgi:RNA polymerase sigma-70 factor (ECF subfamily)
MIEKNIISQFQKGSKSAFEIIFHKYYKMLCHYAMFLSLSQADAENIVQQLFIDIWKNHSRLIIKSEIKSYLYTSLKNKIYNFYQHDADKQKYIEQVTNSKHIEYSIESSNELETSINKLPTESKTDEAWNAIQSKLINKTKRKWDFKRITTLIAAIFILAFVIGFAISELTKN